MFQATDPTEKRDDDMNISNLARSLQLSQSKN